MTRTVNMPRIGRLAALAALAVLAFLAPSAHAGLLVSSATNCAAETFEQPFLRWADPASYVIAPSGTVESSSGWKVSGASRVLGNEPWYVHAAGETHSLSLPAGSSATTGTMCVGLLYPTIRLFARNPGSSLSQLRVEALIQDQLGLLDAVPVGSVAAGPSWSPTLPMPIVANLLPLLPGERTPVRFRFTPQGSGGAWQIDDVYVDPYRR